MTMPQQPAVYNAGAGYPVNQSIDGNFTAVDVYGTGQYGIITARLFVGAQGPVISVAPSGDVTGATDYAAITAAIAALPNGGVIQLGLGAYYVNQQITLPAQTTPGQAGGNPVCLQGAGASTVLYGVGAGLTVLYCHRTSSYGNQFPNTYADLMASFIRDLTIDGRNTTGASTGLDIGDGWGYDVNVAIVNFTGAGSIGLNIFNRVFWTEKGRFVAHLLNNDTACAIDTNMSAGGVSHEYCDYWLYMFCKGTSNAATTQQGLIIRNGASAAGCTFFIRGNGGGNTVLPTTQAVIQVTGNSPGLDYSQIFASQIFCKFEGNGANAMPFLIVGSSNNAIQQCSGQLLHSMSPSTLNGAEFSFSGPIGGEACCPKAGPPPPSPGWAPGGRTWAPTPR